MSQTSGIGAEVPGSGTALSPRGGDDCEEFIRAVYQEYGTLLMRYAARLLGGDWHKAEDTLQEAAARAWKHFGSDTVGTDPVTIRPWLFTVVRNLVVDLHRARGKRPDESRSTDDIDLPVGDAVDRLLTSQVVLDALGRLSDQHREVVILTHYLGYSVNWTAEHLGIPPGTVKSRCYYAMRALEGTLRTEGVLGS